MVPAPFQLDTQRLAIVPKPVETMTNRVLFFAALFALIVSGCIGKHAFQPQPTGSSSPTATHGPDLPAVPVVPDNESVPLTLHFEGCKAFDAYLAIPRPLAKGNTPEGWEPMDRTNPLADYQSQGFMCDKFSLGPFERGPIFFIADMHDVADIPLACGQPGTGRGNVDILNALFVSDPDVAAFMNRTYNMPVLAAAVQYSNDKRETSKSTQ